MDDNLQKLLQYINSALNRQCDSEFRSNTGLTLSHKGVAEVIRRWNLTEKNGGYSTYWKEAKYE